MTWEHTEQWLSDCSTLVQFQATEANPEGLESAAAWYATRFQELGFSVQFVNNPSAPYRPLLVAIRPPRNGVNAHIGFFHHYDVEPVRSTWNHDPWVLTLDDARAFGRGMADNIGPFIQRLILIEHTPIDAGLVFVVQGEEEIGSPFAEFKYPTLKLPEVDLWIEETGYFYKNGSQRVLTLGKHALLADLVQLITEINGASGRNTRHRKRALNKAFGAEKCPCLAHLLNGRPYLSIGPNDDASVVHGPNESISIDLLEPSAVHLTSILRYMEAL